MAGVFEVVVQGEKRAFGAIEGLADTDTGELLDGLGALLESQHRRRIEEEHTSPGGQPFAPNQRGTTPLFDTGRNLRDAFAHTVGGNEARLTNSFIGAGVLHFGGIIKPKDAKALSFSMGGNRHVFAQRVVIPARPFMGISADNELEILQAVEDFIGGALQ